MLHSQDLVFKYVILYLLQTFTPSDRDVTNVIQLHETHLLI
jgi:hypothetical protein